MADFTPKSVILSMLLRSSVPDRARTVTDGGAGLNEALVSFGALPLPTFQPTKPSTGSR